jgi:hypothetical protein
MVLTWLVRERQVLQESRNPLDCPEPQVHDLAWAWEAHNSTTITSIQEGGRQEPMMMSAVCFTRCDEKKKPVKKMFFLFLLDGLHGFLFFSL